MGKRGMGREGGKEVGGRGRSEREGEGHYRFNNVDST